LLAGVVAAGVVLLILRGARRGKPWVLRAVAERISSMAHRMGGRYVLSGGVALNRGFALALGAALGREVDVLPDPQFVGALGAALLARG